ncbi:MAG: hypothetical protein IJ137_08355 [Eubacterium sp.]|nr:hypothetical protein [Eubacterium sp.]
MRDYTRASLETYQEVADNCSEYHRTVIPYAPSNFILDSDKASCLNCTHFTEREYCDIDLYDKIVERIK